MRESNALTNEKRTARKAKILKEIREWIVSLAIALLAVVILRTFLFTLIRVDGDSMNPTLQNGERLFVTVYDAKFGKLERGDIVICHYPGRGSTSFVKRAVAVPGDSVYRENGVTHVVYAIQTANGSQIIDTELDPDYRSFPLAQGPDYDPYVLGEDEYFVVGDNRYDSHDSRDWNLADADFAVGPIPRDMITGHVRQVIWPPAAFRTVK